MSRIALLAAFAFAALTGTAHAGGWATVELGAMPTSLEAGKPWNVELIVKQHGVTPMPDLTPSVEITNASGDVRTFTARPTKQVGHYVAEVTFPAAGEWKTRLYDGFTDVIPHRISPLTVTAPGAPPAPALQFKTDPTAAPAPATPPAADGFPWPQTVAIGFVALLFLGGIVATLGRPLQRRRTGTVTLRGRAA
jgi:hypothetical protein